MLAADAVPRSEFWRLWSATLLVSGGPSLHPAQLDLDR
jgi:hypothetical protein